MDQNQRRARIINMRKTKPLPHDRRAPDGAEAAVARVRALHTEDHGCCSHCTREDAVLYPCPTVRALDGEDPR